MNAGAVAIDVGADRAAVEAEHRLVRQNERDRVVIGRAAARRPRLLAEARHHQVGADRHARAGARSERGRARRVIRIGRIAGPGAALIAERRRQHLVGLVAAARIAGAAVVFGVHRLGEDDRALVAKLLDQHMVARRKVDVVARVAAAGRAHIPGIERVLEREHHAVHRHLVEIGIVSERLVQLGGALQRVGLLAEELAHRRRIGRQRAERRMLVELAPAGDRALAADVERADGVELAGVRNADDHAELLRHLRFRGGCLHAAEFERRAFVLVEIGQDRRSLHRLCRELERATRTHHAGRRRHRRAVLRHQRAGDAVVGAHAGEVVLHHRDNRGRARPDRRVQVVDRRLFETKRLGL